MEKVNTKKSGEGEKKRLGRRSACYQKHVDHDFDLLPRAPCLVKELCEKIISKHHLHAHPTFPTYTSSTAPTLIGPQPGYHLPPPPPPLTPPSISSLLSCHHLFPPTSISPPPCALVTRQDDVGSSSQVVGRPLAKRWRGDGEDLRYVPPAFIFPLLGGVIYGLIRPRAFPVELLKNPYIKVCLESIKQMAVRFPSLCLTFAFNPILFRLAAAEIKTDNFQNKSVCVCMRCVCETEGKIPRQTPHNETLGWR